MSDRCPDCGREQPHFQHSGRADCLEAERDELKAEIEDLVFDAAGVQELQIRNDRLKVIIAWLDGQFTDPGINGWYYGWATYQELSIARASAARDGVEIERRWRKVIP